MLYADTLQPALIHSCRCGSEMRDNIRTLDLKCDSCNSTISKKDRMDIEMVSRTILEISREQDIEAIQLQNVVYEIDEAVMPTGILPFFMDRIAQTSLMLAPEREFYFRVVEYDSPDVIMAVSHLFIEVNPDSKMTFMEALPIVSHTIRRIIEMSRVENPTNPYINDLRTMSMSELAEGLQVAS